MCFEARFGDNKSQFPGNGSHISSSARENYHHGDIIAKLEGCSRQMVVGWLIIMVLLSMA